MDQIVVTRRLTSPFLQALPSQVEEFDAYIYAVVKRKPGMDLENEEFGADVRIDPAILKLKIGTITAIIPKNINKGIESIDDLDEDWFESVEAAFMSLIYGCLP